MKILVVDDSKRNRRAAKEQLESWGHDVMVQDSYSEVFKWQHLEFFDAALVDLLMPAEPMCLGEHGLEHLGELTMVGYPLSVFLAHSGVKRVAVVTRTNHHDHPASAMMDFLLRKSFSINGATVKYLSATMIKEDDELHPVKDWAQALEELLKN